MTKICPCQNTEEEIPEFAGFDLASQTIISCYHGACQFYGSRWIFLLNSSKWIWDQLRYSLEAMFAGVHFKESLEALATPPLQDFASVWRICPIVKTEEEIQELNPTKLRV